MQCRGAHPLYFVREAMIVLWKFNSQTVLLISVFSNIYFYLQKQPLKTLKSF